MEVRRAGEALLRSHSAIFPFLAPAITRQPLQYRTSSIVRTARRTPSNVQSRCLSTTLSRRQNDTDTPRKSPESRTSPLSDLLDNSLDFNKDRNTTNSQRTSRFSSRDAQAGKRDTTSSSIDDLLKDFEFSSTKRNRDTSLPLGTSSRGMDIRDMLDPKGNNLPSVAQKQPLPEPLPVRLGPSLGRSVRVDTSKGVDVGRAFRSLEIACGRNKVRADFNRQRFHERPGLKRKRLKSERWRRKFKEGFRGMVKMVAQMKKKGW